MAKFGTTKSYPVLPRYFRTEAICLGVMVVTFAVDACSYSTIWNCCPKFCHFLRERAKFSPLRSLPFQTLHVPNPPPPPRGSNCIPLAFICDVLFSFFGCEASECSYA